MLGLAGACTPPRPSPSPDPTVVALASEVARLQAAATAVASTATVLPATSVQGGAPPTAPTAVETAIPTAAAVLAPPEPTPPALEDAVALVKQYTVLVVTNDGFGSGISIGSGEVLTARHVIDLATSIGVVFPSGRRELVRLIAADPRRDLALLRSSFTDEPSAAIGDAAQLREGNTLIAVGYPAPDKIGISSSTVTRGVFSRRNVSPFGVLRLQTDTTFNPGNSGGPLADSYARVVGVVVSGLRGPVTSGLNFAVASDEVKAFLMDRPAPVPTATQAASLIATPTSPPRSTAMPLPTPPTAPLPTRVLPTATAVPPPPTPFLGLVMRTPAEGARVPQRVLVQGILARRPPAGFHVWLIVRASVEGGAWYPGPGEIVAGPDGSWSQEIFFGGPPNQRHEIRVGVVDAQAHSGLLRHGSEQRGQPLTTWRIPETWGEARVTVVRQ